MASMIFRRSKAGAQDDSQALLILSDPLSTTSKYFGIAQAYILTK